MTAPLQFDAMSFSGSYAEAIGQGSAYLVAMSVRPHLRFALLSKIVKAVEFRGGQIDDYVSNTMLAPYLTTWREPQHLSFQPQCRPGFPASPTKLTRLSSINCEGSSAMSYNRCQ